MKTKNGIKVISGAEENKLYRKWCGEDIGKKKRETQEREEHLKLQKAGGK